MEKSKAHALPYKTIANWLSHRDGLKRTYSFENAWGEYEAGMADGEIALDEAHAEQEDSQFGNEELQYVADAPGQPDHVKCIKCKKAVKFTSLDYHFRHSKHHSLRKKQLDTWLSFKDRVLMLKGKRPTLFKAAWATRVNAAPAAAEPDVDADSEEEKAALAGRTAEVILEEFRLATDEAGDDEVEPTFDAEREPSECPDLYDDGDDDVEVDVADMAAMTSGHSSEYGFQAPTSKWSSPVGPPLAMHPSPPPQYESSPALPPPPPRQVAQQPSEHPTPSAPVAEAPPIASAPVPPQQVAQQPSEDPTPSAPVAEAPPIATAPAPPTGVATPTLNAAKAAIARAPLRSPRAKITLSKEALEYKLPSPEELAANLDRRRFHWKCQKTHINLDKLTRRIKLTTKKAGTAIIYSQGVEYFFSMFDIPKSVTCPVVAFREIYESKLIDEVTPRCKMLSIKFSKYLWNL